MTPRQQTTLLVAGDCAVFVLFAVIGLMNHEEGVTLNGIVRNAVPFGGAWVLFAWLNGLHRPDWLHASALWQRVASAWLPASALGLALRSIYVWRWPIAAFATVSLITAGVMIVLWRLLAAQLLKRARVHV